MNLPFSIPAAGARHGLARGPRVAFHAERVDAAIASVRLRLLQPLDALAAAGMDAAVYDPAEGVGAYDALVIVKAHDARALRLARAAKDARTRLVYDLCDNLFESYTAPWDQGRKRRVAALVAMADVVTTPTQALAGRLAAVSGRRLGDFRVVPDMLDERLADVVPGPAARADLVRLGRFQAAHAGALRCVWYGSSVGRLSGFAHLDRAARELARWNGRATLTVISDTPWRYRLARTRWRLPSVYLPWRHDGFAAALGHHTVAVIPLERNRFTLGKSINRPATAILAGLGVVADSLPSYEELRPWVALDDWQGGLTRYAATPPAADPALAEARTHLLARYASGAVAARWRAVLSELTD